MLTKINKLMVKYREPISYIFFGLGATLINIIAYEIFATHLGINFMVANVLAWILAFIFAFISNKLWVFNRKSWDRGVVTKEFAGFFGCRVGTGVLDSVMMFVLVGMLGIVGLYAKILVNIVVIILNYVASKFYIFKQK